KIDAEKGEIVNLTKGETYPVAPFPPFMQELIAAGGLMPYVARKAGGCS
ncbi:MAG: 3-isopropylmalate dehydratase small subunit, partial [Moorella humiferrea]|nr:3-isopropylmalate dehydratase small subunit [Moorella humiferrea]